MQQIDEDGFEIVNCSIKPDGEWDQVMNQKTILFRITKDPRVDQASKIE